MSRRQYLSDRKPPKSKIGAVLFLFGTLAALLILYSPWENAEERQQRVVDRVMQKVGETEKQSPVRLVERSKRFDGTLLRIQVVTSQVTKLDGVVHELYKSVDDWKARLASEGEKSELAAINRQAGTTPVKVSDDVFALLQQCIELSKQTDGAFDVTLKPYYDQWSFERTKPVIPEPKDLLARASLVGAEKIQMNIEQKSVYLPEKGMGLDLDLILSAVVLREAQRRLNEAEYTDYFVFFGADNISRGTRNGPDWKLSLPHPKNALAHFAIVTPKGRAVMTANRYSIGFVKDGVHFHPYLNPLDGVPAQNVSSIAVLENDPLAAKALAYAAFILGTQKGLALIERQSGAEAVLMERSSKVELSSGMQPFVKLEEGSDL